MSLPPTRLCCRSSMMDVNREPRLIRVPQRRSSFLSSLHESVRNYKYENGRRYHGYEEGRKLNGAITAHGILANTAKAIRFPTMRYDDVHTRMHYEILRKMLTCALDRGQSRRHEASRHNTSYWRQATTCSNM